MSLKLRLSSSGEIVMASFDVSGLFANIPSDEAMDLCTDLEFDEARIQFRELLGFAVKENPFVFNGKLFIKLMV